MLATWVAIATAHLFHVMEVSKMTTTTVKQDSSIHKHLKKKHLSKYSTDIGTPQVPLRQNQTQQEHELFSDWKYAS
jgi:hypothetical protein